MEQVENTNTGEQEEVESTQNTTDISDEQSMTSDNACCGETDVLKREVGELKDKYLRLFADFDNAKKRHAREQLELIQTAGKDLIKDLLPVLDDFERAIKTLETATEIAAVREGMALIQQKLTNTLGAKGLKPIEALHKDFDVEEHEAVTEVPAPSADLAGKVIDEIQKGYALNGKIIRFAKVVVGK